MHTAEVRARFLTYSLGRSSEACSEDLSASQNEDSLLRILFGQEAKSLIFATQVLRPKSITTTKGTDWHLVPGPQREHDL